MPVESSEPEVPGLCDYARNDEVEDQTLCGEYRDVTPSQHITSSTGARRCDTWAKRLSISPSRPSSSYRLMVRRKVRGHTPGNWAASIWVKQFSVQPSLSVFKSHQSSLLVPFCPSTSWDTVRTGQIMGYMTGQFMCCLQRSADLLRNS